MNGSCLCERVCYSTAGPLRPVIASHCTQCRKSSSHFAAANSTARTSLTITGEVLWYQSSLRARRGFCKNCSSQMFWDGPGNNLSIFLGCFEAPIGLTLSGHTFCAEKGDYYELADSLLQAEANNPGLTRHSIANQGSDNAFHNCH